MNDTQKLRGGHAVTRVVREPELQDGGHRLAQGSAAIDGHSFDAPNLAHVSVGRNMFAVLDYELNIAFGAGPQLCFEFCESHWETTAKIARPQLGRPARFCDSLFPVERSLSTR